KRRGLGVDKSRQRTTRDRSHNEAQRRNERPNSTRLPHDGVLQRPVGPAPGADRCEPMPCGAKRFGIDCGSYRITPALLHAMRASIEFARARVLQAPERM